MKTSQILLAALLLLPLAALQAPAQADDDINELIKQLKPKAGSAGKKSLKLDPAELEARTLNRLSVQPRPKKNAVPPEETAENVAPTKPSPIAPELLNLPSAELEINFERNSSNVLPKSVVLLSKLASALNDESLLTSKFLVAGHTDSKGSNGLNQSLSKSRANAVRKILVEDFDVKSSRIVAIGFGEEQLKNSNEPESAENRRVEIINFGGN